MQTADKGTLRIRHVNKQNKLKLKQTEYKHTQPHTHTHTYTHQLAHTTMKRFCLVMSTHQLHLWTTPAQRVYTHPVGTHPTIHPS